MGGKDTSYQVVYRGETLKHFKPGQCVFFQRERQYGGGYWLGKTHVDGFEFLLEQPTSKRGDVVSAHSCKGGSQTYGVRRFR